MLNWILAVWMSFSFRSAYIQPNPFDWEVLVGLQGKCISFEYGWERENGVQYWMRETEAKAGWGRGKFGGSDRVSVAKDLSFQEVYGLLNIGKFYIPDVGLSYTWEDYTNPSMCLKLDKSVEFRQLTFSLEHTTDLRDKHYTFVETLLSLGETYKIGVKGRYKFINDSHWWQAKIVFSIEK